MDGGEGRRVRGGTDSSLPTWPSRTGVPEVRQGGGRFLQLKKSTYQKWDNQKRGCDRSRCDVLSLGVNPVIFPANNNSQTRILGAKATTRISV